MSIKNFFFAPLSKGLGATRRAAMLLLVMMLTTVTTWADNYVKLTSTTKTWKNNTYVTNGNVTIADRINVTGNVTLILTDGDTLRAPNGIEVKVGNSLTIEGGTNGTGTLIITKNEYSKAGIGGGSGTYSWDPIKYGNITINGGIVNVKGGAYGAGIGGNNNSSIDGNGTITINGGIVNATGGTGAAGIGGGRGYDSAKGGCGAIVINGGQVTATGGYDGPGIGPGKGAAEKTSGSLKLGWTKNLDFIQVTGVESNVTAYGFSHRLGSISFDDEFNIVGGGEATTDNIKSKVSLTLIPKGSEQYQLSEATISGISASYDLTGSYLDIPFSVSDAEGKTLTLGTDYTATLGTTALNSASIHITEGGKYTLTITGMGSYAGSKSIDFEVVSTGFKKDANGDDYINMPKTGIENATIPEGVSSFKVYDDGGAKAKYSNNYDGGLVLIAPDHHVLQLTGTVTAEVSGKTLYDYLMVYDGGSTSAPKIGNKYGSESGANIGTLISSGTQMTLTFHSDVSGQRDGLDLTATLKRDIRSCDIANIEDQTYTGSAIEPDVTVTDGETTLTLGTDYEVAYSNNISAGTATITITGKGNYAGTTSKTFNIVKATPTVTAPIAVADLEYKGSAQALVNAGSTDFGTLLYSLDGNNYSEDIPTATDAGTYTVYYKVAGDANHNDVSGSIEVTISPKAVTNDGITVTIPSQVWTGSELTPVITVKDGETVLVENTDYTVTAPSGTIQDAGDYTYTISGKGNYSGEKAATFTIIPKAVTNDGITIAAIADRTYTGSAIEPEVTVTDGETPLTLGTDYTIGYSANVNVGTATATITGMGNYSGEKAATFTIIPKAVTNDGITIAAIADQTYTGSAIEPEVTVNDGETTLSLGTDYEVAYSNNVNAGTATATITGKGNYSGEKAATFTIAPKLVTNDGITVTIPSQVWTGSELTPVITVKDGETVLTENTDYTVTAPSGTIQDAGDYTYTISGVGNYSGEKAATFTISPKAVTNDGITIAAIADRTYTGSAIEPEVTVTDGETTLALGTDYTIGYSANVNVGTATATITGKGNYSGEKAATFTIIPKLVTNDGITIAAIADQTYTGSAIVPEVTVTDGETTLTLETDYTIGYSANVNVGTATATITGMGNYTGSREVLFTIAKATTAVTDPTAVADLVYNGSAQALVNAGNTNFGTLLYSLDGQNYSDDIPTGTDAGTYTVYYKVEGSDNWNAVAAQTIEATITYFDASLAAIVDNSDVISNIITNYDSKANVTLSDRTLWKDGGWNTLCLPFDVSDFTGTPLEGATVKELDTETEYSGHKTGLDGTTLYLYFKDATKIDAGKPYIIKWASGDNLVNPVFTGVTVSNTKNDVAFTGGTFMGNYAPLEITEATNRNSIVVLAAGNKLGYTTTDRTIENGKALGAFRAYFYIPEKDGTTGASSFVLNFGDEETTTGIVDNKRETITNNHWYSLDGRKLDSKPTQKGLYIVNGRKVVIK